ncbi:MAG: prolyl oligopeptidase family serine peptidase [Burkholderiaceae bacterium]
MAEVAVGSLAAASTRRGRRRMARAVLLATLAAVCCAGAAAQQRVEVPSLDRPHGAALLLPGIWFAASRLGPAPAWVLLHGCSGAYGRDGELAARLRDTAQFLNQRGMHALVLDSLTPRGEHELCTQRVERRRVTQTQRRRDVLGALQWLAARGEVDRARLGLMGWSNGGSTVLAATNVNHPEVAAATVRPSRAVAFYPGCAEELRRGYRPLAPLLLLLGEIDDWTPIAPCLALAARSADPQPEVQVYAGAGHGFDSRAPVRLRSDVPGGARPGAGVHVGGNAAARKASRVALQTWLDPMASR